MAGQEDRIIREEHIEEITIEQLIEDYNLKLFLTEQNYIKRYPWCL